jgi:hypothetical protein
MKTKDIIIIAVVGFLGYTAFSKGLFSSKVTEATQDMKVSAIQAKTPVYVEKEVQEQENKLLRRENTAERIEKRIVKNEGQTEREQIQQDTKTATYQADKVYKVNKNALKNNAKSTANIANQAEETQRYTEYGTSAKGFLKKTFMPTTDVAQDRRDAVVQGVTKIVDSVKGKIEDVKENISTKTKSLRDKFKSIF